MEERTERGDRSEGSIGATPFVGHGRPSRTFPRGRICAEDACETLLSIYNEGRYCSRHEPQVTPRMRGRKIA
jgi:hypothetical protein